MGVCTIEGCDKRHHAKGFCDAHYRKFRRYGDPLAGVWHGLKGHPLYSVWSGMRVRCLSKSRSDWKYYGGRGITICERWGDVRNFIADMHPRPQGMSLDRKDNDGPYSPENCRWATQKQQVRNSRTAKLTEAIAADIRARRKEGVPAKALSRELGVADITVRQVISGRTWQTNE